MNAPGDMPRLSVRDLRVAFATGQGRQLVVDGLSFDLQAGETLALVGESGSGKSMTALALMRLLPAGGLIADGDVSLGVESVLPLTERDMRTLRGTRLAMIFQEPATSLNPVLTLGTQIGEVLRQHRGLDARAAAAESERLLAAVGIADATRRVHEYPFQISGGMKQRAMIAMALAGDPEILIADEPTTALDVTIQAEILALLADLQAERGMSMLLITHDLGVVRRMANRVGVMYAGELVETAERERFFSAPQHPYSRGLFGALPAFARRAEFLAAIPGQSPEPSAWTSGCRFAPRCPHAQSRCQEESPGWQEIAPGHRVRCHFAGQLDAMQSETGSLTKQGRSDDADDIRDEIDGESSDGAAAQLLTVDDLRVHFPIRRGLLQRTVGWVRAVDGLSFSLQAGKTLALVGESGCGKTTVGKAIMQLISARGGEVRLQGESLAGKSRSELLPARQTMQMIFQDPFASLNPKRSVGEILAEGLEALDVGAPAERPAIIVKMLSDVGLPADAASRYPHAFSGGQRQRIAIARALAVSPKLLICDEPTSALDVSVQAQILNLLRSLQRERGLAYLFITHNFGVVEFLADTVAVMYLGRIVEQGPAEVILKHAAHPYTEALLAAVPSVEGGATAPRMSGESPSPASPPGGCHFHPRCPYAEAICRSTYPPVRGVGAEAAEHTVRCHFPR